MRMNPAFQVLLWLCLLGVSFATPKQRNIRWCVTSDIEFKKCKDLVNSCNVNKILLSCVRKSSTENCVRAISDGEADAISLDSGDLYKASLNPYKLKPIMSESSRSRRADTPCLKERQKVLDEKIPAVGRFVPQCDEKGNYSPQQCHGSTGYCWCVNAKGEEITGTKTPPGQPAQNCEAHADTPCLKERQKLLTDKLPLIGRFVPQCDEKGNYSPQQCHGSTGYCWCVNAKGEEITGTKTPPGQPAQNCEAHEITPCLRHRQSVMGGKEPSVGAFVPQCDDKGNYVPQQCHASTGYCWCVKADGKEIEGTKTGPGKAHVTCEDTAEEGRCLKERQKALGGGQPLPGAFVPNCDEKGNYRPKQCHGSTGYCWCVNKNGEEISGSRTPPGQPAPTCGATADTPCLKELQKVLDEKIPAVGRFVPQCDEKGNYSPQQCHGSTGYCWCVNAKGEEITGTKTPPGQPAQNCEAHADTPCLKERQKLLAEKLPLIGRFIPQCDEKGNYSPQQCHGSTGYCWCVNVEGKELAGTKTPPVQRAQNCEAHANAPCFKEHQKQLQGKTPIVGRFLPQCDEWGNYRPQQCHGSTGYCWCVNENGEEISGTKTPPGQPAQNCDPVTCHYAVAVVKKSSTLQFDQLKGKRSCHSAVGEAAGWIAPMNILLEKKLLLWEEPEYKSLEKAVSEFFSASCAPGAKEAKLCQQCSGQANKCKRSHGEPYYGNKGALRCLRDGKGDLAFVKDSALSGQNSDDIELLCPDNTRKPLNQYKDCNFGKVPTRAVVTSSDGDKTKDIIEYLLEAQKKQCKLFSSTHGEDLLFEDTTTRLITLPSVMDTSLFLGLEMFYTMKAMHGQGQEHISSSKVVNWCTQNKNEKNKCDDWSMVSGGAIECIESSSAQECIAKVVKGEADAVTVSVDHMFTALKCGLVPAVEEYRNKDDFAPCQRPGTPYTDFGAHRAVAVVKKKDKDITWNNLKGKKSCHSGVGDQAGWTIPISLIRKEIRSCDIGSFFNESCAPGSAIDSNLCKLCIGDPQNAKAETKCSPNDKEAYYGNGGAIRCLVEKGDVAFVTENAVFANTDGKNPALWAKDLKSTDFELLCPDGSRAPVSDYKKCRFSGIPPRAVITRQERLSDVVRNTINQQSLYGRKGFEKDIFQMFSSSYGQNLLFNDDTQCLIEFDRQIEKDIMDDYFGTTYRTAVYKDNHCLPASALASACAFHHC